MVVEAVPVTGHADPDGATDTTSQGRTARKRAGEGGRARRRVAAAAVEPAGREAQGQVGHVRPPEPVVASRLAPLAAHAPGRGEVGGGQPQEDLLQHVARQPVHLAWGRGALQEPLLTAVGGCCCCFWSLAGRGGGCCFCGGERRRREAKVRDVSGMWRECEGAV